MNYHRLSFRHLGCCLQAVCRQLAGPRNGAGLLLVSAAVLAAGSTIARAQTSPVVVNVKDYGAKGDGKTDDTQAISEALSAQQSKTNGACLHFPPGIYRFSIPFNTTIPLHLEGAGFAWPNGSILEFTGSNQPIIQINGTDNDIENVMVEYQHFQDPVTDPRSACIQFNGDSYLNTLRNVAVYRGCYGLYNPQKSASWQNSVSTLWVQGFSIAGVDVETGGSTWTWNNIYVQNAAGPLHTSMPIGHYSYAGNELHLSLAHAQVPDYMRAGFFIVLKGMTEPRLNGAYAVSQHLPDATADTILVHTRTSLGAVPDGHGEVDFMQQEPVAGYPFTVSGDNDISGLDVEHAITRQSAFLHFGGGGAVNISHLHLEALYSTRPAFRFINDESPALNIGSLTLMNMGFKRNSAASLIATSDGSVATIGNLYMRDVMHDGASWVLQNTRSKTGNLQVQQISTLGTIRADAEPTFDNYGTGRVGTRPDTLPPAGN